MAPNSHSSNAGSIEQHTCLRRLQLRLNLPAPAHRALRPRRAWPISTLEVKVNIRTAFRRSSILVISLASLSPLTCGAGETLRQCASVASSRGEIDGDNRQCGETRFNGPFQETGTVMCGTATVQVPSGKSIISYSRSVSPDIGWTWWMDDINVNGRTVSTKLKNWSHNTARTICLEVEVE